MKKILSLTLFALSVAVARPQISSSSEPLRMRDETDERILSAPLAQTRSTQVLGSYIREHFANERQRIRAIFTWVASNIEYDVERKFAVNLTEKDPGYYDKILQQRKGVCIHYASLFTELCRKTGIAAFIVEGFTRQNGNNASTAHAWVVARVDREFYLFDPTWAAGFVQNQRFVKRFDDQYFMTPPKRFAATHLPFDYMWQLMTTPAVPTAFLRGQFLEDPAIPFFNYRDSIEAYVRMDDRARLENATTRIVRYANVNDMSRAHLRYNIAELLHYKQQDGVKHYQFALTRFKEALDQLNGFIDYANRKYQPFRPEQEVRSLVEAAEKGFLQASGALDLIESPDETLQDLIGRLRKGIHQSLTPLNVQKASFEEYLLRQRQSLTEF